MNCTWIGNASVDNIEHVVPAAPQLAHLLVAAPDAAILATSRVALGVAGEDRIEVQPLTTGIDGSPRGGAVEIPYPAQSNRRRRAAAIRVFGNRGRR